MSTQYPSEREEFSWLSGELQDRIRALEAENRALRETAAPSRSQGALETLIGNDTPWPLADVLARLADAADHLLSVHDCDMQGWEGVGVARDKAREIVAALRSVASPVKEKQ